MILVRAFAIAAATRGRFAAVLSRATGRRRRQDEDPLLTLAATARALTAFLGSDPRDRSGGRARTRRWAPAMAQTGTAVPPYAAPHAPGSAPVRPGPGAQACDRRDGGGEYRARRLSADQPRHGAHHRVHRLHRERRNVVDEPRAVPAVETPADASDRALPDGSLSDQEALTLSREWQELASTEQSLESLIHGMSIEEMTARWLRSPSFSSSLRRWTTARAKRSAPSWRL